MTDNKSSCKGNQSIERVYNYVKTYIHNNTMSPSVREICIGAGLKSTSSVHSYLRKLDEIGRIEYRPGMRRAIIIKDMDDVGNWDNNSQTDQDDSVSSADVTKLYCVGKITAGVPIYAHEDYSESYYVDKSIIGNSECFMLRVQGSSMINAHILDGDILIIRKQNYCNEGEIVAALVGDEATVKRFGRVNGTPFLFPENELFSPIPYYDENCKIMGKVIGLHRYTIN